MNLYIVYCDFEITDGSGIAIAEVLNNYTGIRFMPTAWIIHTSESSNLVFGKIAKVNQKQHYIIVSRLDDEHTCNYPPEKK